jgi:hypothetical protein
MTLLSSLREWWRRRIRRRNVQSHGIAEFRNTGTLVAREGTSWWIQDEESHAHFAPTVEPNVPELTIGDCVEFEPKSQSTAGALATNRHWTIVRKILSIEATVELVDGSLVLRIPLSTGGDQLAPLARGIGQIKGEYLCVVIQPWLAEKLRIGEGSLVIVDDTNKKFTITRSPKNDEPATR